MSFIEDSEPDDQSVPNSHSPLALCGLSQLYKQKGTSTPPDLSEQVMSPEIMGSFYKIANCQNQQKSPKTAIILGESAIIFDCESSMSEVLVPLCPAGSTLGDTKKIETMQSLEQPMILDPMKDREDLCNDGSQTTIGDVDYGTIDEQKAKHVNEENYDTQMTMGYDSEDIDDNVVKVNASKHIIKQVQFGIVVEDQSEIRISDVEMIKSKDVPMTTKKSSEEDSNDSMTTQADGDIITSSDERENSEQESSQQSSKEQSLHQCSSQVSSKATSRKGTGSIITQEISKNNLNNQKQLHQNNNQVENEDLNLSDETQDPELTQDPSLTSNLEKMKRNKLVDQKQKLVQGSVELSSSEEDNSCTEASQSLLDPPRIHITRSVAGSSASSRSALDARVKAKEERYKLKHKLELEFMDNLEKQQAEVKALLVNNPLGCVGEIRLLLVSLAPLMEKLKLAHCDERKDIAKERERILSQRERSLFKFQIMLMFERQCRLVHIYKQHTEIAEQLKEVQLKAQQRQELGLSQIQQSTMPHTVSTKSTSEKSDTDSQNITQSQPQRDKASILKANTRKRVYKSKIESDTIDAKKSKLEKPPNVPAIAKPKSQPKPFIPPANVSARFDQEKLRKDPIQEEDSDHESIVSIPYSDNDESFSDNQEPNLEKSNKVCEHVSKASTTIEEPERTAAGDEELTIKNKQQPLKLHEKSSKVLQNSAQLLSRSLPMPVKPNVVSEAKRVPAQQIQSQVSKQFTVMGPTTQKNQVESLRAINKPHQSRPTDRYGEVSTAVSKPIQEAQAFKSPRPGEIALDNISFGSPGSSIYGASTCPVQINYKKTTQSPLIDTCKVSYSKPGSYIDAINLTHKTTSTQQKDNNTSLVQSKNNAISPASRPITSTTNQIRQIRTGDNRMQSSQLPMKKTYEGTQYSVFPQMPNSVQRITATVTNRNQTIPSIPSHSPFPMCSSNKDNPANRIEPKQLKKQVAKQQGLIFADLADLISAGKLLPGHRVMSIDVKGKTFHASLSEAGHICGEGGEIFKTAISWFRAVHPEHQRPAKRSVVYPKVCYKGRPLSNFVLSPKVVSESTPKGSTSKFTTAEVPSILSCDHNVEPLLCTLLNRCMVAIHRDEELVSHRMCGLPVNFWTEPNFNAVKLPKSIIDDIDCW